MDRKCTKLLSLNLNSFQKREANRDIPAGGPILSSFSLQLITGEPRMKIQVLRLARLHPEGCAIKADVPAFRLEWREPISEVEVGEVSEW